MNNVRSIANALSDILREEIKKRHLRSPEDWEASERLAMYWAVNSHRKLFGKADLPMAVIDQVDNSSSAIEDYALRCAKLVIE